MVRCTTARQRTAEMRRLLCFSWHAQGACASFSSDRPVVCCSTKGMVSVWYILGLNPRSHGTAKCALTNAEWLREGLRLGPTEAWVVKGPSLNSSAAVGQVRCLNLTALGQVRRFNRAATPIGVWWLGYSCRGTDTNLPSKLPSAYSDRGDAFPRKIKGGIDRYSGVVV